jgi:hypothetical protein
MINLRNINLFKRQHGASLLGLAFDGTRLEGVVVRRTNGSVDVKQSFSVSLSLDLLTDDPELVGREIRKHLDAEGVRERWCTVCVPLTWALTLAVKLPDLPEADLSSFLQIEAERGFPYSPDSLMLSPSRYHTPGGESYATLVAIPRDHLSRLEAVLKAAQLRPVSFSLGIVALQHPPTEASNGVLALAPGENSVGLQVSCDGGVVVMRTVEGAFELEGGEKQIQADRVAREARITLGQLPSDVRDSVRRLRVFGRSDTADELTEQLRSRVESMGIKVEQVREYAPGEFSVELPADVAVSPALSLAVRHLTKGGAGMEFLPPKISAWKQITTRYASGKLAWAGGAAGAVVLVVAIAFLVQQWQLWRWGSKWGAMKKQVTEVDKMQQQIKRFRPWFDDSYRSLSILRRLTESFPEDGTVSAKTIEIRSPATVTCIGTARDYQALLRTLEKLRTVKEISSVQVETIRGKAPMQFTFNFQWGERSSQ